jgi:hypothetical protein
MQVLAKSNNQAKKEFQFNMKKTIFILFVTLAFVIFPIYGQRLSKDDIEIGYAKSDHPGRFRVVSVKNKTSYEVSLRLVNEYKNNGEARTIFLKPGEERRGDDFDITCNVVMAKARNGNDGFIIIKETRKAPDPEPKPQPNPVQTPSQNQEKPEIIQNQVSGKQNVVNTVPERKPEPISTKEVISDFCIYIESSVPFLSLSAIDDETKKVKEHINNLKNWKDRDAYIKENSLHKYIDATRTSIDSYSEKSDSLINAYMGKYKSQLLENEKDCTESLKNIIMNRLEQRDKNITRLESELNVSSGSSKFNWKNLDWMLIGICAAIIVLLTALFVWFRKVNKKDKLKTASATNNTNEVADAASAIVVRRKTTSVLRKQSLDDVEGNDAYLRIDCNEFCDDSAVRIIYIKNTCIKDIYNMYAEDLRNPNNPKEDGCMVLGRWVHDNESNEYYVSLEQIVLPGDDAVFSEYELNFGGKIKLKVTERLRKLRRDTNLQYDLTCWVHSHPGLGVFFSNSDCNVQTQLKHPVHPNFLTAMVVDILTPEQELGIFTFKHDSTINSKAELKKMYSLEEMYEWAVKSERNSFKREDFYNTLSDAKTHANDCYGIELSNGAIIDMGMLVTEQVTGLVGMVLGYSNQMGVLTEIVADKILKGEPASGNDLVGCFIIATHCSIPSLRKTLARYIAKIKFVLVYSTTDGLLTSIPIVNGDICADEKYYGEQQLEDLKIWTRRKR